MPERTLKTVEFTSARQAQVRRAAVQSTEMLFDMDEGNVYFTGRRELDIHETVMRLTILDVANLAGQMLQISAATLVEAISVAQAEKGLSSNVRKH